MKTKKISPSFVGLGALAVALCLNFVYASNDYGISDNSLSIEVLAQMNRSDSGDDGKGTGTGTGKKKAFKYEKKTHNKITISCNGLIHESTKQPGYWVICEGTGNVECDKEAGWYPTGEAKGDGTEICPAVNGGLCKVVSK